MKRSIQGKLLNASGIEVDDSKVAISANKSSYKSE